MKPQVKTLKIGIAAGLNPLLAKKFKEDALAAAHESGICVEFVEDSSPIRTDAPTARIALGDRKIAGFLSAKALEDAGCALGVLADMQLAPYMSEVQNEVQMPLLPLFRTLLPALEADSIKRAALLGTDADHDFFVNLLKGEVELIAPTTAERDAFALIQGFASNELTEDLKTKLVKIGRDMISRGAQVLIPNSAFAASCAPTLIEAGLPVIDVIQAAAQAAVRQEHAVLPKPFKVGMIGGLGPAATVDLYDKIVKATPAKTDQEHIKLVVEQNPQIPDRTAALLHGGVDPTLALYNCAKRLQDDDCDAIIVPCNTAHAFIPYLERHLRVPFINMQQAALDEIAAKLGDKARIGLLATSGTIETGIYGEKAKAMGLPLMTPDEPHQARVMAAIYGPQGAKAGFTDGICREDLLSGAEYLVKTYDCNCLILGCTELPLILDESDAFEVAGKTVMVIDPTAALARKVVALAQAQTK